MTLSEYLLAYLGKLNDTLEYAESDLTIVIADALLDYGVDTEADATDPRKLHDLALVHLWKKIMVESAQSIDVSVDGSSFKQSQMYEMAKQQYLDACSNAMQYNDSIVVDKVYKGRCHVVEF